MNTGIRFNYNKRKQDEVRRLFLMKHSNTPDALLGGHMEKEAYLDSVIPSALDAASIPQVRR